MIIFKNRVYHIGSNKLDDIFDIDMINVKYWSFIYRWSILIRKLIKHKESKNLCSVKKLINWTIFGDWKIWLKIWEMWIWAREIQSRSLTSFRINVNVYFSYFLFFSWSTIFYISSNCKILLIFMVYQKIKLANAK